MKHKQAYQSHLGKRSLLQQQVISHFDRYLLLGRRADQFEMFQFQSKFVCDQLQKGRHRYIEGARAIVKFIYAKSSRRRKRRLTLAQFLCKLENLF